MKQESLRIIGKLLLNGRLDYIRSTHFILKYTLSVFESLREASFGDYCIGLCPPCVDHDNTHVKNVISSVFNPLTEVTSDIHNILVDFHYNKITDEELSKFDHDWNAFEDGLKSFSDILNGSSISLDVDETDDFYLINLAFMANGAIRSIMVYMISNPNLIDTSYYYNQRLLHLLANILRTLSRRGIPDGDFKQFMRY